MEKKGDWENENKGDRENKKGREGNTGRTRGEGEKTVKMEITHRENKGKEK